MLDSTANSTVNSLDGIVGARIGCSRLRDRYFEGAIDDLRIYNRALSSSEIAELYNFQPVSLEGSLDQSLRIFPNPTSSVLNILVDSDLSTEGTSYSILDLFGRTVRTGLVLNSHNQVSIDELSNGAYFIKIEHEDNTLIQKIIIE